METALNYSIRKSIYNYLNRFMVSWWGTDSYFNNGQIQIGDIELMTALYGSSGSFGSIVRFKSIVNSIFTVIRSTFCSKKIPIHGPVHKSDFNYSYLRIHFSWLPQAVAKKRIYCLSQKFSYASKIIDPVINGFSPNEVRSHLHICNYSIVTFGIRVLCLESSNTSRVNSLDGFRASVVGKVKTDLCI